MGWNGLAEKRKWDRQGNKKWLEKAVGRKGSNQEARGGCLTVLEKGVDAWMLRKKKESAWML